MSRKGPVLESLFWVGLALFLGSMMLGLVGIYFVWSGPVWLVPLLMFLFGGVIISARLH